VIRRHPILEFHPLIQYHDPQHIHPIYTHKEIFPPETFGHDAKDEPILLRNVLYALASLCQSEEGAWAVVGAQAVNLDSTELLSYLDPPDYEVARWTCRMLAYISGHGDSILSTRVLDSDLESCRRICSLLR
jgi:hypothetical protein